MTHQSENVADVVVLQAHRGDVDVDVQEVVDILTLQILQPDVTSLICC